LAGNLFRGSNEFSIWNISDFLRFLRRPTQKEEPFMRSTLFAMATTAAVLLPLASVPASAGQMQLAQADIRVGPGPAVEERRGPGVTIEERHHRPGVVIEETEGRRRDCVSRSESASRNGVTVTEHERDCR
jgi:hypothetical protein